MIVVIGDLVADIVVLGGSRLERGTDNTAQVSLTRGGSAANVAASAATRHPTRFIGRVGDDTVGDALVRELERAGVEVRVQRGARTGAIVILVDDDGERTMVTDRGASAELQPIDAAWLEDAEWLHLPLYGFAAPVARGALVDAAARVRRRGIPISLDLSSVATMRELGSAALAHLIEDLQPSVVFANADEAASAAQRGLPQPGTWVIKRGADAVRILLGGEESLVPVEPVADVVDTTGAGDAFAAGFIAATLGGAAPRRAASAGNALARRALIRAGAA